MKKSLPLLTLCMSLCCVSCYDDSFILERLDALEKNAIASINEQISAIKSSITSLEAVDKELKATIQTLEAKDASQQGEIDKLKEADASLETKIGELKTYVDEEISNTEEWATTTFATIEKYNEIVKELSSLKEVVESNYATLDKKIDDSIESIKAWVNEELKGYYTSAEVDELLTSLKDDLEALQAKLDNLLRDFTITFDDTEIGILAGGTTSVGYTITGATDKTTVKALGQNGWSAKVTPEGTDKGKITVTAPNPLTEDEIIVLVYDGEYRTIMSSINFVTGVVTPSQTAVELEAEAGTVDITVTSNLNYNVSIPEEAQSWLSVVETKATKTETMTFAYAECIGSIRKATVAFVDEANKIISTMTFIQQGSAVEVTLTEAGTLLEVLGENIYKDIKGLSINGPINGTDFVHIFNMTKLNYLNLSNANIVEGGLPYDSDKYIKNNTLPSFSFNKTLKTFIVPKGVTEIGSDAFRSCSNLEEVILPSGLLEIGSAAFLGCSGLKSIIFPEGLTRIGNNAFGGCYLFTVIEFPASLTKIGSSVFQNCNNITTVRIKALPTTFTSIGQDVFLHSVCYEKATLYIPSGTKTEYMSTDFGKFINIIEE